MNKTQVEVELLAPSREKPGGQQQQYSATRWPFPVRHYDQDKCEMQYRAFRDAYNKLNTDYETGGRYAYALSDAELRMRWLSSYYTEFGEPTQQQIARWAEEVHRGKPADIKLSLDTVVILMLAAAVCVALLF